MIEIKNINDALKVVYNFSHEEDLIFIGGLSRSGKTNFANKLKNFFLKNSSECQIISLDNWLKPKKERKLGVGVLNRYNLQSFYIFFDNFFMPSYKKNTIQKKSYILIESLFPFLMNPKKKFKIIIEGIPALMLRKDLLFKSNIRIFIQTDSKERKKRFDEEYFERGLVQEEIDSLYSSRNIDEVPYVELSKKNANFFVNLS